MPQIYDILQLFRTHERHEINLGINFKIAVNDEFSDWDIELNEGDRLVFIPPVTGG